MKTAGHGAGHPLCALDGRRIAYATVGEGPTLVFGGRWVTHLEEEWQDAHARRFFEDLARSHRVVRYDRLGTGLSDREGASAPTVASEVRTLRAILDECGPAPVALFACSCAGVAAAHVASHTPERISRLVFFGAYVSRADIPAATRRSLVDFVRTNWPLAAQMLAGLMAPRADGEAIDALSRAQRHAARAEVAAAFLELDLTASAARRPPGRRASDAGAPSARRPDGPHLARPRGRAAPAERALRRARRRRAPAVDGRAAGASPRARRVPR
jgi:pimeloyl-ACP methyl ester carboxylesterase